MGGRPDEGERYEFFGPGLVELSRLTTGKAAQEVDEVKTMLLNQGYPEATVHRFFAPLAQKNVDVVDKKEEARTFYAYINRNGSLHNNGMVATGPFIAQLDREPPAPACSAAARRTAPTSSSSSRTAASACRSASASSAWPT